MRLATYLQGVDGAMFQSTLLPLANVALDTPRVRTLCCRQLFFGGRAILRVGKSRSKGQQVVDDGEEALWNLWQLSASRGSEGEKKQYLIASLVLAGTL
jgi:hypothetical protein